MTIEAVSNTPAGYSEAEWATRVELAALYRVVDRYGMTDIANQEIGARVEGEPDCFLVHPYGLLFDEVRASDFVKVRLDGEVIDGPGVWTGKGQADFVVAAGERWISDGAVHLGQWIFGTRPDQHYFIHGHCEEVVAVSSTQKRLLAVSQAAIYLGDLIAYLDYDFQEDDDYAALFMRTISDHDIIVAHNHGYYTLGRSASEAFFRAYYLRQACSMQIKAASAAAGMGDTLREIDPARVEMIQQQMRESPNYHYDGSTEWAALLRQLERSSPDYRS